MKAYQLLVQGKEVARFEATLFTREEVENVALYHYNHYHYGYEIKEIFDSCPFCNSANIHITHPFPGPLVSAYCADCYARGPVKTTDEQARAAFTLSK